MTVADWVLAGFVAFVTVAYAAFLWSAYRCHVRFQKALWEIQESLKEEADRERTDGNL